MYSFLELQRENMRQVYSAEHPTEAHIVKGILESAGIEAVVKGDILFSARGEIPITPETAPSVWILEESRFDEARGLVRQYELANSGNLSSGDMWTCVSCAEKLEGQFTHCWKCGEAKQFPAVSDELP
jgi:hypothetical protein